MTDRKRIARKKAGIPPGVVIAAFNEDQVSQLTGISKRQLRYWDSDGFFTPSLAYHDRSRVYSRLYSFRDLQSLRVLNRLRNEAHCSLPHLRDVKSKLAHLGEEMWAKTTLYVVKKRVVFVNPDTQNYEEVVSGQSVMHIMLKVVTADVVEAIKAMQRRGEQSIGKLEKRRGVVHNQLVIAGTRIPVRSIKAFHDAGYSVEQINKEYPTLTPADIHAAINHRSAA